MAKRKTHEEFVNEMKEVNPNIEILGEYISEREKILCKCKIDNNVWCATPTNLLRGRGCPVCGRKLVNKNRKKTHDDFVNEISKKSPYIKIIGQYNGSKNRIDAKCLIHNYCWSPFADSLCQGQGCPLCGIDKSSKSQTKTHQEFIEDFNKTSNSKNIEIIGTYTGRHKRIKARCKIHDYLWEPFAADLLRGYGCKFCRSDKMHGHFATSQEEFIEEIKEINQNIEVVGNYINRHTRVLCKCKLCGNEFYVYPDSMHSHKRITCPVCSDGISYPNKYIRNFLKQLPIENLEYEWKLKDYKQYSYDNYFIYNDTEYIVEADGAQHYQKNKFGKWKPDEVQERDKIKNELAANHNIKMIRIDCQKSEANYIKEKILCSELSSIFDLSNIDWDLCNREALNSLVKQVCDLYKDGYRNIDIENKLKISKNTVTKYLKLGNELGWCKYTPKQYKKVS